MTRSQHQQMRDAINGVELALRSGGMTKLDKAAIIESARVMMGIPRPNADVLVSLLCAWGMGYRTPASLAHMAGKMMREQGDGS
jgi:hypothetical protein